MEPSTSGTSPPRSRRGPDAVKPLTSRKHLRDRAQEQGDGRNDFWKAGWNLHQSVPSQESLPLGPFGWLIGELGSQRNGLSRNRRTSFRKSQFDGRRQGCSIEVKLPGQQADVKKSFTLLLSTPSFTMASNFSATALSRL